MKNKKPNAASMWKQFEDLAPRLRLSTTDRVVYSHLLRHSRLEGRLRLRFSNPWLARGAGLTHNPVRWSVRRLIARGVLRLIERSKSGHTVEVHLRAEIHEVRPGRIASKPLLPTRATDFEQKDFLRCRVLRNAIHNRERGLCFYCRRRLNSAMRCLDHVVPRVELQDNSLPQPRLLLQRMQLLQAWPLRIRLSPIATANAACPPSNWPGVSALSTPSQPGNSVRLSPRSDAQETTANPHKRDPSTVQPGHFAGAKCQEKAGLLRSG